MRKIIRKFSANLFVLFVVVITITGISNEIVSKMEIGVITKTTFGPFYLIIPLIVFLCVLKYKSRYWFIGLLIVGISLYAYNFQMGFSIIDSDAWAYSGYIEKADKFTYALFGLPPGRDAHFGTQVILGNILYRHGVPMQWVFHFLAISNFILLMSGMYLFAKRKYGKEIAMNFVLISFFLWGSYEFGFKSYSIIEIWHFFFNSMFAFAMLFFALYFATGKEKFDKMMLGLVCFLCIINHLVIGVVLMVVLFCFYFARSIEQKSYKPIIPFIIFSGGMLILVFLWPYFDLIAVFKDVIQFGSDKVSEGVTPFSTGLILIKSIGIPGIMVPFLFKKKEKFLPLVFIVSVAYVLTPMPYNKRFVIPAAMSLHLVMARFIQEHVTKSRQKKLFFGSLIILTMFVSISRPGMSGFYYRADKLPVDVQILNEIIEDKNALILSDRSTEYLIRSQTDFKGISPARMTESKADIFFAIGTEKKIRIGIIQLYNIQYVFVNKRKTENFGEIADDLSEIAEILFENEECIIFKMLEGNI